MDRRHRVRVRTRGRGDRGRRASRAAASGSGGRTVHVGRRRPPPARHRARPRLSGSSPATLLFENRATVLFQIEEMCRAESITDLGEDRRGGRGLQQAPPRGRAARRDPVHRAHRAGLAGDDAQLLGRPAGARVARCRRAPGTRGLRPGAVPDGQARGRAVPALPARRSGARGAGQARHAAPLAQRLPQLSVRARARRACPRRARRRRHRRERG